MSISITIKQQACERLFHFHPVRTIARELGVSAGAVRDWRIFSARGDFDWISESYVKSRKPRIQQAVMDWLERYPIGYSDVARLHGVRPSDVYREIHAYLERSPSAKLPLKLRYWKRFGPGAEEGRMTDMQERIRKMVHEQISEAKNEKELKRNLEEMFVAYECLFEEVLKDCDDELKKKELQLSLDQLREVIASLKSAES